MRWSATRAWLLMAVTFTCIAVLTLSFPAWIESVFGIDPDGGGGGLEWAIVAATGVPALVAWGRLALVRRADSAARVTR